MTLKRYFSVHENATYRLYLLSLKAFLHLVADNTCLSDVELKVKIMTIITLCNLSMYHFVFQTVLGSKPAQLLWPSHTDSVVVSISKWQSASFNLITTVWQVQPLAASVAWTFFRVTWEQITVCYKAWMAWSCWQGCWASDTDDINPVNAVYRKQYFEASYTSLKVLCVVFVTNDLVLFGIGSQGFRERGAWQENPCWRKTWRWFTKCFSIQFLGCCLCFGWHNETDYSWPPSQV